MKISSKIFLVVAVLATALSAQTQNWSRIARGTSLPAKAWSSGYLFFRTADSTLYASTGLTWVRIPNQSLLDIPAADMLSNTAADSASDSTVYYQPVKMFALGDTATFSFVISENFASIDSIVALAATGSALGDSAAFALQIKQFAIGNTLGGAFNAAVIDTVDLGTTANAIKRFAFTGFGSISLKARRIIVGKIWRSACDNSTGSGVYILRLLIYGIGLR